MMSEPSRIQLCRTKGWRKPEGAIVVARPTKWGNPFSVMDVYRAYPSLTETPCGRPAERRQWEPRMSTQLDDMRTAPEPPRSRSLGIYVVTLEVRCSLTACTVTDEASVRDTACEDARQGVMRVLRYRGWQIGRSSAALCPQHAPALIDCARCGTPTPPFYLSRKADHYPFRELEQLNDVPPDGQLCPECCQWAGDIWRAQLAAKRAER